jgi:hypothetical protein
MDLEQHNAGHTMSALLDSTDPNAELLFLFCFGIPKELRDNIDKNVARSPKDIASTRVELRERFFKDAILGGVVKLSEAMATSCIGEVSQIIRIVECIRNGKEAKTSGAVEVGTDQLDMYSDVAGQAVEMLTALDHSSCPFDSINKNTLKVTPKTGGGLKHRFAMNHTGSILVLAASYKNEDGTIGFDQDTGLEILQCFKILGDKNQTDKTEPMVCLRHTIDRWDAAKKHKGTDGMNVRWTALKLSLLMQLAGEKIKNPNWLDGIDFKKANDDENYKLNGYGVHYCEDADGHPIMVEVMDDDDNPVVETNEEGVETPVMTQQTIVCGIDDYVYVDPAKAAAEAASEEPTDDGSLNELAEEEEEEEEEEMDDIGDDVPEEEEEMDE